MVNRLLPPLPLIPTPSPRNPLSDIATMQAAQVGALKLCIRRIVANTKVLGSDPFGRGASDCRIWFTAQLFPKASIRTTSSSHVLPFHGLH